MSYFVAPDTGARYDIFGPSYAQRVAELARAPVLARIPIDPRKARLADEGRIEELDDPTCDLLGRGPARRARRAPETQRNDLDRLARRRPGAITCSAPRQRTRGRLCAGPGARGVCAESSDHSRGAAAKDAAAYTRATRAGSKSPTRLRSAIGILRVCLRAAGAVPRPCNASRSGVASSGFVLRAALARRCDRRAADVVRSGIFARAAFRLDRSNSTCVAGRVREERAVERRADRLPCDAARLCGARAPRRWPWLASLGTLPLFVAGNIIVPLYVLPLFNAFEPVTGSLEERLRRLAARYGVGDAAILRMDMSRQTRKANAFVTGIGRHAPHRARRHADRKLPRRRNRIRRRARARPLRAQGYVAPHRDRRALEHHALSHRQRGSA